MSAAPQQPDGAERAFREGRFADAERLYLSTLELGAKGDVGALCFNLGRCAEETGRHAEAYWRYRCAERRLPDEDAVRARLERVAEKLGVAAPERASPATGPSETWMLGGATVLLAAGIRLAFRARGGLARAAAAALVVAGFAAAVPVWRRAEAARTPAAVVLGGEALGLAAPRDGAALLFRLSPGEELTVLETSDRWSRVRHLRGTAWVRRDALGFID
jgi:hypothetical protein